MPAFKPRYFEVQSFNSGLLELELALQSLEQIARALHVRTLRGPGLIRNSEVAI